MGITMEERETSPRGKRYSTSTKPLSLPCQFLLDLGSRETGLASKTSELFCLSCRWHLGSLMYYAVGWECPPEVWASLSLLWTPLINNSIPVHIQSHKDKSIWVRMRILLPHQNKTEKQALWPHSQVTPSCILPIYGVSCIGIEFRQPWF